MTYGSTLGAVKVGMSAGIGSAGQAAQTAMAPRTIASAASRMDAANERLSKARDHLSGIADQLGALRPVDVLKGTGEAPPVASGAVSRLNDSADQSHRLAGDIESLLSAISDALG